VARGHELAQPGSKLVAVALLPLYTRFLTPADYGGLEGKCHEALVLHRPDVIEELHRSMVAAGAEVVETDTFQASRIKLDEWGLGEHTFEINQKAAEIARKAVGEELFVAGSIGPTGHLPASDDPTLGSITFAELVEVFTEQAQGLVRGGVDLLIIETAQDILEVKAAIFGAREAFRLEGREVPIQVSVSLLPNGGKMLLGTDINAVLTTLEALKVDVIGLNCSTGPNDMRDAVRFLGEHSPIPVHCIPNAGLPQQGRNGETIFPEGPEELATVLGEFVEQYGVGIVGVGEGDQPLAGVVSERDIVAAMAAGADPDTTTAQDIEVEHVYYVDPTTTLEEVAAEMLSKWTRHLFVGEPENLLGVVSARDVLGAYAAGADLD